MIKTVAASLITFNLLIFLSLNYLGHNNMALSFFFVSTLLLLNFIGLVLMWRAILIYRKTNLVVLSALIKYPLLGLSIFWAGRQPWINAIGIVIGICAFLIIIVVSVLIHLRFKKSN